jgi:hypothetical protein
MPRNYSAAAFLPNRSHSERDCVRYMSHEGKRIFQKLIFIGIASLIGGYFLFTRKNYLAAVICLIPYVAFCIDDLLRRRRIRHRQIDHGPLGSKMQSKVKRDRDEQES